MTTRVLILGGGYAGVLAAQRIAGKAPDHVQVTLMSDRPHFTERIRLHERAAGGAPPRIPLATLLHRNVDLRVDRAEAVDLARGEVRGRGGRVPFDYLVTALGSHTDWGAVPGALRHAFAVGDEDAAERLAAEHPAGPLIVVGAGLTGVELAAELAETRGGITLVGALLPGHSARSRAYVRQVLRELGVTVREDVRVTAIEADAVHLDQTTLPGRAIWCGGFARTRLEGISSTVDATLRGPDPRVFGAGDQVVVDGAPHLRMACATAMPLGAHAADSLLAVLAGREPEPFRFRFAGQCVSLGRRRGVLQLTDGQDAPRERILRGRLAAFVKERICSYTRWSLQLERRLPGLYHWPRSSRAALPARTPLLLP